MNPIARMPGILVLLLTALLLAQCGPKSDDVRQRIDLALNRANAFLINRQSPDGAWRSSTYGALSDGMSLTLPVMKTVLLGGQSDSATEAFARALAWVRGWDTTSEPDADHPLDYPVYTASLAVIVLGHVEDDAITSARDHWLELLRSHQLTEQIGWTPDDIAYGGWGYSLRPPRKPSVDSVERLPFDSDLSSTMFAVGALRLSGASADDPVIQAALHFVQRCQNFNELASEREDEFDDGGFFLTPTNVLQNKAGVAGIDRHGRSRLNSYGSATADGVRALLRCGLPPDHPRVIAARSWLEKRFSVTTNPGVHEAARESDRDAPYYYYCWSIAHAFRALDVQTITSGGRDVHWALDLAEAMLERQAADGSWRNRFGFLKEDDPLIATTLAAGALANCRETLWPTPTTRPAASH